MRDIFPLSRLSQSVHCTFLGYLHYITPNALSVFTSVIPSGVLEDIREYTPYTQFRINEFLRIP